MIAALTVAVLAGDAVTHNLSIAGPRDWTYDARLVVPFEGRSGLSVLLIGGGIGNDLEWTVPGTLEWNGTSMQMTIDGTSHRDAPRIAEALTGHGHSVMYFSTIAREDPKRDRWPLEMTMMEPADLLVLAQQAANALRTHSTTDSDDVVLVAHSMGAQRACVQAAKDQAIKAIVLLGAAQMTRTGPDDPGRNLHREAAAQRLNQLDADGDGAVRGAEIPRGMDFDDDNLLRVWEVAADMAKKARPSITDTAPDKTGMAFGEDSLQLRPIPTLALYGSLDEAQACHAPVLQSLVDAGTLPQVSVRMLPNIGHQLGPEQDGRAGPISDSALDAIVAFVDAQVIDDTAHIPSAD